MPPLPHALSALELKTLRSIQLAAATMTETEVSAAAMVALS